MKMVVALYPVMKRALDIVSSLLGLIVLSPIFLFLVIAIKLDSKGPVLFKQNRIGKDKKTFNILKFRTMRVDTPQDVPTHLLDKPGQYITKTGRFLRKTSLDELPQLCNILVGHMSVVGPRPALWNQHDLISARDQYGANDIRPGLTGWAQISGRDELPIKEKAGFDGAYTAKMSFSLDLKLFFITLSKVLRREGIIEGNTASSTRQEITTMK